MTIYTPTGGVQQKVFHCKTFFGAWWLIGQYRCAGLTAIVESFDGAVGRYVYMKSLTLTEYHLVLPVQSK